jgi:hypothetical protein
MIRQMLKPLVDAYNQDAAVSGRMQIYL